MAEESTPARPPPLLCEVSDDLRIAMALLERRIDACRAEMPALAGALTSEPGADEQPVLTVGHGALWFQL